MKKEYNAPVIEYLAFSTHEMLAVDEIVVPDSFPFNDDQLGWT